MNRFVLPVVPLFVFLALSGCGSGGGDPDSGIDSSLTDLDEVGDGAFPGADAPAGDLQDSGPQPHELPVVDTKSEFQVKFPLTIDLTCTDDADCSTSCGNGKCEGGNCNVKPLPGYCLDPGDPGDALCYLQGQTSDEHPCLFCNPKVTSDRLVPMVMEESFEEAPLKFNPQVSDLTGGGITWVVSPRRAHWGALSLYFGDPQSGSYANGFHVGAEAKFVNLTIPGEGEPQLRFFLFMETEETEGYDILTVEVLDGDQTEMVFHSDSIVGTTQGVFIPVAAELTDYKGKTIGIVFRFDSIDGGINSYEGVFLDGVRVTTGCCSADHDCNDGDPCTDDDCPGTGEACLNDGKPDCCLLDSECDDLDSCTSDGCPVPGETCSFESIPGCCHGDDDCDDGDECTQDQCPGDGAQCLHLPNCCETTVECVAPIWCIVGECIDGACTYVDNCCHSDDECHDMDPCTVDQCIDGDCLYKVANVPGCCWPEVVSIGFETGAEGFSMDPPVGGVGWSVVTDGKSASPPGALYYGNPSTKDFDNGMINEGSAAAPLVTIPDGFGAAVTFHAYMDTESSSSYDQLTLSWRETDGEWNLWSKDSYFLQSTFVPVEVNVSAFAGRAGELVFHFNTVDAMINYGEGVYVDDLALTSTCAPVLCANEQDCNDGLAFTQDSCNAGNCNWEVQESGNECTSDWDCDDYDWCTYDYCINGTCEYEWDPWCWY